MDEKLRILLCEDDENLGMLLREYLQAKGYSAELYPDGSVTGKHEIITRGIKPLRNHGFVGKDNMK